MLRLRTEQLASSFEEDLISSKIGVFPIGGKSAPYDLLGRYFAASFSSNDTVRIRKISPCDNTVYVRFVLHWTWSMYIPKRTLAYKNRKMLCGPESKFLL